jgi:hypothetical protein
MKSKPVEVATSDLYNMIVIGKAVVMYRKKLVAGSEKSLSIDEQVVNHLCEEREKMKKDLEVLESLRYSINPILDSSKNLTHKKALDLLYTARRLLSEARPGFKYSEDCEQWCEERSILNEQINTLGL